MNSIKFSITIPAYKGKFLGEAIESVLAQTYDNFELIIVDDCSPEDLKSIVGQFQDSRIRYYRNDKNCGAIDVVDNWNICLSYCTGEYVICMGDDDRLKPCCLNEYVKLIEKYPDLNIYHSWTEIIDENNRVISIQQPRPEIESGLSLMWNRWNGRNRQYIGDFCYRLEDLRSYGGFYKLPLAWASDDISAVRAAINGGIANTQEICFQYRVSRITITNSTSYRIKLESAFLERAWYRELYLNISKDNLISSDLIYYSLMKSEIERHFYTQRRDCLINEFSHHPINIFVFFKKREVYEISIKLLVNYWLEGIKMIFSANCRNYLM